MPEYANKLVGEQRRILELRPGITGPATLEYADKRKNLHRYLTRRDIITRNFGQIRSS